MADLLWHRPGFHDNGPDDGYSSDNEYPIPQEQSNPEEGNDKSSTSSSSGSANNPPNPHNPPHPAHLPTGRRRAENYSSIKVDEQIRNYERLQEVMYPNTRIQDIAAQHEQLRYNRVFPTSNPENPRTSLEQQWTEEHSRPMYHETGVTFHPRMPHSPLLPQGSRRQTLHQLYVTSRNSPTIVEPRRESTFYLTSNTSSLERTTPEDGRPSLASLAQRASTQESISPTKENILRMLQNQDHTQQRHFSLIHGGHSRVGHKY